jgi:hypothetical protein
MARGDVDTAEEPCVDSERMDARVSKENTTALEAGPGARARLLRIGAPWAIGFAVALPTLVFSYLPMTDLPQHVAISAILSHPHDPHFGFDAYYRIALDRSPYLLPYAVAIALAPVLSLELAVRVVVFLSVLSYFAGIVLLLRHFGKPWPLVLLAVPFAYHRAFFWGFVSFDLAVGLSLVAMALFAHIRSRRGDALLGLVLIAIGLTHVYGLLLFVGYAALEVVTGRRGAWRERVWPVALATVELLVWVVTEARAPGVGISVWPTLRERVTELPQQVLGGYADASEPLLLVVTLASFVLLTYRSIPVTLGRWRRLDPGARALWLLLVVNLVLYFVLPRATPTAKFVHFRHAVLAALLLPALAGWDGFARLRLLTGTLLVIAGVGAGLNAWDHLRLFNAEARPFERALAAIPERPRLIALTLEPHGRLMITAPYLHFGGYVQAQRGGVFSMGFPELFWNVPVALRGGSDMPPTPINLESRPWLFEARTLGVFYDTLLVRTRGRGAIRSGPDFPYELVFNEPPWQVYRHLSPPRI